MKIVISSPTMQEIYEMNLFYHPYYRQLKVPLCRFHNIIPKS